MAHITLLAYENCAASGIYGLIDGLGIANRLHNASLKDSKSIQQLFNWDIVSMDGLSVKGEGGITMVPNKSIHDIEHTDFILIPGFLSPLKFIGNVPDELTRWLSGFHEKKVLIGSTCTGTFLLAETGLIHDKTVTTNFKFSNYFKRLYPDIHLKPEDILTEDTGFLCSGATTSYLDLGIYLIEKFGSPELAEKCAKTLLVEPRKSQSAYFTFDYRKNHSDQTIKKAQDFMESNFNQTISVEALASDLGISQRHFVRRFKRATGDSPLLYLQRIRIETAKKKLEKTMLSIDEITQNVGYENPNSFRKLFKKNTGLSPSQYRNRFAKTKRQTA